MDCDRIGIVSAGRDSSRVLGRTGLGGWLGLECYLALEGWGGGWWWEGWRGGGTFCKFPKKKKHKCSDFLIYANYAVLNSQKSGTKRVCTDLMMLRLHKFVYLQIDAFILT